MIPASSSTFESRCPSLVRCSISRLRYLVRWRSAATSAAGMKLGRSSPCSCSSAIHWQSAISRLRPGTLRMCAALHTHTSIPAPARAWWTGHQYTPVLSIAASVTPSSASQAAIFCSGRQNVLNLLVITFRSPGASPGSRTATQATFLCTSIPATRGWTISTAASFFSQYRIRARRPRGPRQDRDPVTRARSSNPGYLPGGLQRQSL